MAGWVKIYRQIQDSAIWMSDEPFDIRSAWIDLILMANHEEKEIYQGGKFFKIKRGQLHRSQMKLAERWHWSKKRVVNYLKELKKAKMIDFESSKGGTTQGTTISIVNYDIFQIIGTSDCTSEETSVDTSVELRRSYGGYINKNIKNVEECKEEREEPQLPPVKIKRNTLGKYQNVYLSNEECAKLVKEFGEASTNATIESLSIHMQTKKTNYRDDGHYAVICKWITDDRKKNPRKEDEDINARQRAAIKESCKYGLG